VDFVDKTQPVVARNGEEAGGDLDDIEAKLVSIVLRLWLDAEALELTPDPCTCGGTCRIPIRHRHALRDVRPSRPGEVRNLRD